jgi:putative transposase
VRVPRLGSIRTKESTEKFRGRILSATVRREADRWYVSLTVEAERSEPPPVVGPVVGVDLGLLSFGVVSDGASEERIEAPKPFGAPPETAQAEVEGAQPEDAGLA